MDDVKKQLEDLKKQVDTLSQARVAQMDILTAGIKQSHLVTGEKADGDLYYGDGANNFTRLPIGSTGQLLTVVNGTPVYAPDGLSIGDVLYYDVEGNLSRLGPGTVGQVLTTGGVGVIPSWTTPSTGTNQSFTIISGAGGTTTSVTLVDLGSFSQAITTTGKSVYLSFSGTFLNDVTTNYTTIALLKDGSEITRIDATSASSTGRGGITLTYLDVTPTVASHTYKIQWRNSGGNTSTWVGNNTQFTLFEV